MAEEPSLDYGALPGVLIALGLLPTERELRKVYAMSRESGRVVDDIPEIASELGYCLTGPVPLRDRSER